MRRVWLALLLATVVPVFAQSGPPPGSKPLPDVPPPPPGVDAPDEPQVTITKRGTDKVEEYRVNGKLYMMKVTPPGGIPYYLVDDNGDGTWSRQQPTDSGVRVPRWVVHSW